MQGACDPGNGDNMCIPSSFNGAVLVVSPCMALQRLHRVAAAVGVAACETVKAKKFFFKGETV